MSSSTFRVCACVVVLVAVVTTSEGVEPCGRHKRDIMTSIFNEPADFYETGRQRRHVSSERDHHHHHHHNHNYSRGRVSTEVDNTPHPFSSNMMTRLNEVETHEDFMKQFITPSEVSLRNRLSDDGVVSNSSPDDPNIPIAVSAKCKLEEVTVALDIPNFNPNHFYFPTCTRVKRCGGCCTNTITSCQPTRKENVTMKILETVYQEENQMMAAVRKVVVQVENHIECKCGCTIKPEDCSVFQTYKSGECRCVCNNVDEMEKCQQEDGLKVWDHNTCHCSCRDVTRCRLGHFFFDGTCSCVMVPRLRRRATFSDLNKSPSSSTRGDGAA